MNPIVLFIVAITGTLMVFIDPLSAAYQKNKNKTKKEVHELIETFWDTATTKQKVSAVATYGGYIVLLVVFVYIIYPGVSLSAIFGNVGNQLIGIIVFGISMITWVRFVIGIKDGAKTAKPVESPRGTITILGVEDTVWFDPKQLRIAKATMLIPSVYTWYLLAVAIHIITF